MQIELTFQQVFKRLLNIGISVVLLAVVLYYFWPKASLDGPIVVSAQIDESAKTITISYITT